MFKNVWIMFKPFTNVWIMFKHIQKCLNDVQTIQTCLNNVQTIQTFLNSVQTIQTFKCFLNIQNMKIIQTCLNIFKIFKNIQTGLLFKSSKIFKNVWIHRPPYLSYKVARWDRSCFQKCLNGFKHWIHSKNVWILFKPFKKCLNNVQTYSKIFE